jgi:hypothetical protein
MTTSEEDTMTTTRISALLAFLVIGCGGAQGPQPHDMSVAQHEAMAQHDEEAASAVVPEKGAGGEPCDPSTVCWSARQNPTPQQVAQAEEQRKQAAAHRAAARALRDAETNACAGLSEADRDTSPFAFPDDIAWVKENEKELRQNKNFLFRTTGARAFFRAAPGLTVEWLQRIVDCHLARAAAVGHDMPEMNYCPLVLRDVTARVSSTGNGFLIEVQTTGKDPKIAEEIVRRMNALVADR